MNGHKKWLIATLTTIGFAFCFWVARSIADEREWRAGHELVADYLVNEFTADIAEIQAKQELVLELQHEIRERLIRLESRGGQ